MRRFFEKLEQTAIDVIMGRRTGKYATLLCALLLYASYLYRKIVAFRLALYRSRLFRQHIIGCPVVSIGNLTVGGTGKTPIVEKLARELNARGRHVAILSRGYKSIPKPFWKRLKERFSKHQDFFAPRVVSEGGALLLDSRTAGDEPFMLAKNLKEVAVLVDRDRVKSGLYAIKHLGCDLLLLDDGLQYLKLRHRFDIVLIDREAPFGNEFLLPRGTLREPPENLRRATHIIITKCTGSDLSELHERIRKYNRTAEIIECRHRPVELCNMLTGELLSLDHLKNLKIGVLSGIASPESFEQGLRHLGAELVLTQSYADHHRYSRQEIERFMRRCARRELSMILTTEKDAVRIPRLTDAEIPIYYLRIEIEILKGADVWNRMVDRLAIRPAGRIEV
ncbi:MAG: tetraacyldisaccharide 4'-kinase [Verrucomicrobia bacterium RIFCSPHIGHO2_12_FULL_41_10]|nr:MAG: tetraacyldisaccharide 4'-kinase [Verrucomicrobia bacterium RIFCSPHIGHO2_12_FULL_41_10]HLB33250.1 tetraacyldisaccharide 4'-kinase [Chthoniobacterales bacterium]